MQIFSHDHQNSLKLATICLKKKKERKKKQSYIRPNFYLIPFKTNTWIKKLK